MEQTSAPFGALLKDWRSRRRMSQLDLGLTAGVSARHLSFLETGRARPSRAMVLRLCETLGVPRAARNALLNAAGFAPVYRRRPLSESDMQHVRAAVEWSLHRHDPFPAFALDRHWTLVKANASAAFLLAALDLGEGESLLRAATETGSVAAAVQNWPEVARHLANRWRTESAHLGGDAVLDEAADALMQRLPAAAPASPGALPAVTPTVFRLDGTTLSFFSSIAQFGTAEDIALAELKIELLFPADEATRRLLLERGLGR